MSNRISVKFFVIGQALLVVFLCAFGIAVSAETLDFKKKLLLIDSQASSPYAEVREAMLAELDNLGYTKAAGFSTEYYSLANYGGAAKSLWRHRMQRIDYGAIFLNGTLAVSSFKNIAWNIPNFSFVFATVTDPVGVGVVDQYDTPPVGNFTGISFHVPIEVRMGFIRRLMPNVKNIGFVYADMAQSHSYRKWIEDLLKTDEWKDVTVHFRQVNFIPSDGGHHRMAQIAMKHIKELDPLVDVFLAASDQMGAQKPFAEAVAKSSNKPLIGLGRKDVVDNWGVVASIYLDYDGIGRQAAQMVKRVFSGEKVETIFPERPKKFGIIIDEEKAAKFNISISADLRKEAEIQ